MTENTAEITAEELHELLRHRAKGGWAAEAATELLIRTNRAYPQAPWIAHQHHDDAPTEWWIDWDAVPDNIGYMSGGEQRMMKLAASIGGDCLIDIGEVIGGLDTQNTALALAAIARAAGKSHLFPWPDDQE